MNDFRTSNDESDSFLSNESLLDLENRTREMWQSSSSEKIDALICYMGDLEGWNEIMPSDIEALPSSIEGDREKLIKQANEIDLSGNLEKMIKNILAWNRNSIRALFTNKAERIISHSCRYLKCAALYQEYIQLRAQILESAHTITEHQLFEIKVENAIDLCKRYKIGEEYRSKIKSKAAELQRFPIALATLAMIDSSSAEIRNYAFNNSCMLKDKFLEKPWEFMTKYKTVYNKATCRLNKFKREILELIEASPVYKTLTCEQINEQEDCNFSPSFINQLKYLFLNGKYISKKGQFSTHGYASWAIKQESDPISFADDDD